MNQWVIYVRNHQGIPFFWVMAKALLGDNTSQEPYPISHQIEAIRVLLDEDEKYARRVHLERAFGIKTLAVELPLSTHR